MQAARCNWKKQQPNTTMQTLTRFTSIVHFLATFLLPHSSHSAQDGMWDPHAAAVTCRNFVGMYKLQDMEDSKAVTLPGSLDTPKPKVKLPLPSEGLGLHLWVSKHSTQ